MKIRFNISDTFVVTVYNTFHFLIVEGISTWFGSYLQCFISFDFRIGSSTRIARHSV